MTARDVEHVVDELPIRQGDVLKRIKPVTSESFSIVVSADCDIAQSKLGDAGVACVSLVALRRYFLSDYGNVLARRQLSKRLSELTDWVNKRWLALDPGNQPLTRERVTAWVNEASIEEIEGSLNILTDEKACGFLRTEFRSLTGAIQSLNGNGSCIDALAALQRGAADRAAVVRSQFGKLDPYQLPLDLFFVSEVPGESAVGFVAKLRSLSFVPFASVFTSLSEARDHEHAHLRVGRLTPTYKHGLAQQLGALFSRIGYHSEYELDREAAFDLAIEELARELGERNA